MTVRDCAELASVIAGAKSLEAGCRVFLKSAAASSAQSVAIYLLQDSGEYLLSGSSVRDQQKFPNFFELAQISSEGWLKNLFDEGYSKLDPRSIFESKRTDDLSITLYQVGVRNGKPAALLLMEISGTEVPVSLHDWSLFTKAALELWLFTHATHQELKLTIRQSRIQSLVLQGYRNSEIALKMSVSASTVKQELGQIYRLNSVSTRAELSKALNPLG